MEMKQAVDGPRDVAPGQVGRRASPRGRSTLAAILPSGRVVWLKVKPALAPTTSASALLHRVERLTDQRAVALERQRAQIHQLTRTIGADTRRLDQARLTASRKLRRRLTASTERLGKRLLSEMEAQRTAIEAQTKRQAEFARRLGQRDLWDKIVIATSAPLFAAYGQAGSPFATNNLTLALSLLIWLAGDEIAQALFGSNDRVPDALRDPDVWSYLAPIGNLLTGWWLMRNRQHERFIVDFAAPKFERPRRRRPGVLPPPEQLMTFVERIDLTDQIALDHREDFQSFTGVPAVASLSRLELTPDGKAAGVEFRGLTASVSKLELTVTATLAVTTRLLGARPLDSLVDRLQVAWFVDTQEPTESPATS